MQCLITALALFVATLALLNGPVRDHINAQQAEKRAQQHAQYMVERDKQLSAACEKGQTGVVLYYKGKHCGIQTVSF